MKKTRVKSFSFLILFAVLAESNGSGNGCEWSGCQHGQQFVGHCNTGVTGGMGRKRHLRTKSCQLIGFRDFCCDDDCHWFYSCDGMTAYPDDMKPPKENPNLRFCCRINGVIPPGGYVPPVYVSRLDGDKQTISQRPNNGFRDTQTNSGPSVYVLGSDDSRRLTGGFRNNPTTNVDVTVDNNQPTNTSEVGGFRNSGGGFRNSGGGFRNSGGGFRNSAGGVDVAADNNQPINNAEGGGFRNSAGNGGFRNSAGTGGFRTT